MQERRRELLMAGRLEPIPRPALRDRVVAAIRDAVVRGEFKPGEKVPESVLAEQLGVSRTPVREALRILEYQGLVESRAKTGTYIARRDKAILRDGLLVRTNLEQLAFRQAAEQLEGGAWEQLCADLAEIVTNMSEAVRNGEDASATEADVRFHERLVSAPNSQPLLRAWYTAGSPTLVWSAEVDQYPLRRADWLDVVDKHEELIRVFRTHDMEKCLHAIDVHIMGKLDAS